MPGNQRNFIELRLQDINQLFNSMDPSPFHEKELDADAEDFIVSWAQELPQNEPFALKIYLGKPLSDNLNEQIVTEAVKNHFNSLTDHARWQNRQLLKQGWKDLSIGLAFLAVCLGIAQLLGRNDGGAIITVLRESLIIAGWVAMWRPMEYFLYGRWPIKRKEKLFHRLGNMNVELQIKNGTGK